MTLLEYLHRKTSLPMAEIERQADMGFIECRCWPNEVWKPNGSQLSKITGGIDFRVSIGHRSVCDLRVDEEGFIYDPDEMSDKKGE